MSKEISNFRYPVWNDIEQSARRPLQQVQSDLRGKHYAWERAIWPLLDRKDQERVKVLRQKFESLSLQKIDALANELSDLSNEILSLAYIGSAHR